MKKDLELKNPVAVEGKTFVCFSCMQPNEVGDKVCIYCDAPISETLSTDPLQVAYGKGRNYRRAVIGKPKPIVVLGVWLAFLPTFVVSLGVVLETLFNRSGTTGIILFLITFFLTVFSAGMLYRVTKNYFFLEKFTHPELPEDAD